MANELTSGPGAGGPPARNDERGGELGAPRPRPHHEPAGSDLRLYWQILTRRWPLVAGVAGGVVLGTAVATLLDDPTYRATGLMEIRGGDAEMEQPAELFRQENVSDEYLETQYGILESTALARRVAQSLRLDTVPAFAGEEAALRGVGPRPAVAHTASDGAAVRAEKDGPAAAGSRNHLDPIVRKVRAGLDIDPRLGSRLVRVSFEAADPQLAADVVNAALNAYMAMRVQSGEEVVSWLSRQVDSTKARLRTVERELRAYASEHDLPVLETADGETRNVVDQRLAKLEDEITRVRARRIEAESRFRRVVEQDRYRAVDNQVIQDLTVELANLRKEYARLTSVFQEGYPKARQVERQIDELERELENEKRRVAERLRSEYQVLSYREGMLQDAVDEQRRMARRMADESGEYRILRREVETNRKLLAAIQQTKREADVSAALRATRFGIVDMAGPPLSPQGPGLKQNLALALMAGLVLGIGAAFVRERFDTAVRTASEVDEMVGAPLLALIPWAEENGSGTIQRTLRRGRGALALARPRGDGERAEAWPRIDAPNEYGSVGAPVVESFAALRAELFLGDGNVSVPSSLMVTSCQPREGKTTVSLNLAISLAASGRRTLLVDADLRRPSLHRAFGIDVEPGLWEHLTEGRDWRYLATREVREGLDVLPAGDADGAASEVLSSGRMRSFLEDAEARYDTVVLDSIALFLNAPDARILGSLVDGVLVVVRSGVTPRSLARRVMEKAPNLRGVVLNDLKEDDLPGHYGDYYYGYGDEPDGDGRPRKTTGKAGR